MGFRHNNKYFSRIGSKRVMNRTCMESEARQAELHEQAEKIKEEYETLLRSSLIAQKKMGENK